MTALPATHGRSFRLVCEKEEEEALKEILELEGFRFAPEPFSPLCQRLLAQPFPLGSSLAAFFGLIYIQDRSSMLPPLALNPPSGIAILDLCASPGGKTGFLSQLAGPCGFTLANEPNPGRLAVLRANLERGAFLNAASCSCPGEAISLPPGALWRILLDPPCSGWGTTAKHPQAARIWHGEKTRPLLAIQRALIKKAVELLAPGGLLLYSTCTTNPAEDEEQTSFALDLGLEKVPLEPFSGFVFESRPGGEGCLLVDEAASKAQGFYLSLLKKPGNATGLPETRLALADGAEIMARDSLASPVCDPALLPPGAVFRFGKSVHFLPESAILPLQKTRLPKLGEFGPAFRLAPRMRRLLPKTGGERLEMETPGEVRELLKGRALQTGLPGSEAALWLRGLPLGKINLKNGRAVPAFR